jgi:hypothetical protein
VLKGRALDATRDLLYDTAKRGQLSDVMRLIMPFMEAQKEVMKVWAQIGTANPSAIVSANKLIQQGRRGVFYTDPTTGEEMFTFPFSEHITEKLLGMPIPLAGRVQGLNMFGSGVMPGMGPVVQLPARWLIPDKPKYDELRQFIDPFGATAEGGVVEQNLPGYLTKLIKAVQGPDDDRVFANTVKDVWAAGLSSGMYSATDPTSIQEGLADAKNKARGLYAIRGLATVLGAPTAPTAQMMAKDPHGHWLVASKLAEDYRTMMNDDPDTASLRFMEKYGVNAAAFMQAKTYATTASAATTNDASRWLRENPEVAEKYPDIAGLFAPTTGKFDSTQYLRDISSGARVNLTPEQYTRAANDKVGKAIYYAQADRLGPYPSQEQRQWLANLREALRQQYPGFDEALPGKPDQQTVVRKWIPDIERAVADPALAGSEVAQATRVFLAARQHAIASAQAAGYQSFAQAKAMEATRDWLRRVGGVLTQQVPGFGEVMQRVFEREMAQDVPATTGGTRG